MPVHFISSNGLSRLCVLLNLYEELHDENSKYRSVSRVHVKPKQKVLTIALARVIDWQKRHTLILS